MAVTRMVGNFTVYDKDGYRHCVIFDPRCIDLITEGGNLGAWTVFTPIATEKGLRRALQRIIKKAGSCLTYNKADESLMKGLEVYLNDTLRRGIGTEQVGKYVVSKFPN